MRLNKDETIILLCRERQELLLEYPQDEVLKNSKKNPKIMT